jgi:hypothetical protein
MHNICSASHLNNCQLECRDFPAFVTLVSYKIVLALVPTRGSYAIPCVSLIFPSDVGN